MLHSSPGAHIRTFVQVRATFAGCQTGCANVGLLRALDACLRQAICWANVCRYTRAAIKTVADGATGETPQEMLLVVMGEKGRSQLQRDMRESIYATIAGESCRVCWPADIAGFVAAAAIAYWCLLECRKEAQCQQCWGCRYGRG